MEGPERWRRSSRHAARVLALFALIGGVVAHAQPAAQSAVSQWNDNNGIRVGPGRLHPYLDIEPMWDSAAIYVPTQVNNPSSPYVLDPEIIIALPARLPDGRSGNGCHVRAQRLLRLRVVHRHPHPRQPGGVAERGGRGPPHRAQHPGRGGGRHLRQLRPERAAAGHRPRHRGRLALQPAAAEDAHPPRRPGLRGESARLVHGGVLQQLQRPAARRGPLPSGHLQQRPEQPELPGLRRRPRHPLEVPAADRPDLRVQLRGAGLLHPGRPGAAGTDAHPARRGAGPGDAARSRPSSRPATRSASAARPRRSSAARRGPGIRTSTAAWCSACRGT